MKQFSKTELKHLKFKLMKEKGMTQAEAYNHIKELIEFTKNQQMKGGNRK